MLIATLPPLGATQTILKIINEESLEAVRYNTGNESPFDTVAETMQRVVEMTNDKKILYVDIEGRQARVTNWSYPKYGSKVELNREVEVDLPARIFFRGDSWYKISFVNGKNVFLAEMPEKAIGRSQTVNIQSENWRVVGGYLSARCKEYIRESVRIGVTRFCLSFVESWDDVTEVENEILQLFPSKDSPIFELVLKIESVKGVKFANKYLDTVYKREFGQAFSALDMIDDKKFRYRLMTARDDLSTNLQGNPLNLMIASAIIIEEDNQAILASNIFQGLVSKHGEVSVSDISDIYMLKMSGYEHFMFSDELSRCYFDEAMALWRQIDTLNNLDIEKWLKTL